MEQIAQAVDSKPALPAAASRAKTLTELQTRTIVPENGANVNSMSMLDAALFYAKRGWYVIPLHEPVEGGLCTCNEAECTGQGKHPRFKGWPKKSTTNEIMIRNWWRKWPNANVGIHCGKSNLVVVDIDPRHDGNITWEQVKKEHELTYTTLINWTGGGGWHLLFSAPENEKFNSTLGDGIDIKSNNGLIVAPPSLHASGRRYEWDNISVEPAKVPANLLPLIVKAKRNEQAATIPSIVRSDNNGGGYYEAALQNELSQLQTARNGNRNNDLNKAAFALGQLIYEGGLGRASVESELASVALSLGLGEREAEATVKSGLNSGMATPRHDAADRMSKTTKKTNQLLTTMKALSKREAEKAAVDFVDQDWHIFTLADAYQDRDPIKYVVEGLFEQPSLNIVYGAPGTLKSMLLADMCCCIAGGRNWLTSNTGAEMKNVIKTPTLWLDFDNGKRRTHDRMAALARHHDLKENTPFYYISMPSPWLDASKEEGVNLLINHINNLKAGVVVIDNLGVVTSCDENHSDMAKAMASFRLVAEKTNAATILIHHQRKSNGGSARAGDSLRGHSCIEASLDLALLVSRDERSNEISVISTKTRGVDVDPFAAKFNYEHKEATTELETAWFTGEIIETKESKVFDAIIATVESQPGINQSQLKKAVKAETKDGVLYIAKKIKKLVEQKRICYTNNNNKNALCYYLPTDLP